MSVDNNHIKLNLESNEIMTCTYGHLYRLTNGQHSYILKTYHKEVNPIIEGHLMRLLSNSSNVGYVHNLVINSDMTGILMDYYPYQINNLPTNLEQILMATYQLLTFVELIGSYGIIHRDLKPDNILIDRHGQIRVIDFGLSCYRQIEINQFVGTLCYRAPEILSGDSYDCRSDLWSLGCILVELITKNPLFVETDPNRMRDRISQFQSHQKRFIDDLKQFNHHLENYKPYWHFLKIWKTIYTFSPKMYIIINSLLQIKPSKRQLPHILLSQYFQTLYVLNHQQPINISSTLFDSNQILSHQYQLQIPELNYNSIRYNSIRYHNMFSTTSSDNNLQGVNYMLINQCLRSVINHNNDQSFDTMIQALDLFLHLLDRLRNWHYIDISRRLQDLYPHGVDYLQVFQVCFDLMLEFNDNLLRNINYDNYELKQLIVDVFDYQIKQDRRRFHTATNLKCFNTYNIMYNLLYITDPTIHQYTYTDVITHLQKLKQGMKSRSWKHIQLNSQIIQRVNLIMQSDWIVIEHNLVHNLQMNNSKQLKYLRRAFYLYRYRYLRNQD